MSEGKIQKLQKDLTFYINKANSMEHALSQHQMASSPVKQQQRRETHEDAKMSKSMKVKPGKTNPFNQ